MSIPSVVAASPTRSRQQDPGKVRKDGERGDRRGDSGAEPLGIQEDTDV